MSRRCNPKYDVFLSFRGVDTRKGFVRKLYHAFVRKGIETFFDEKSLQKGQHISSSLREAIKASSLCIPILSPNFANSRSCLEEVSCMFEYHVPIYPIFYNVSSSYLEDGGRYSQDLEQKISPEKIIEYKSALQRVFNSGGWWVDKFSSEEDLIQFVLTYFVKILEKVYLDIPECFGVDWSVEHVIKSLHVMDCDKKIVKLGIHGMSGIGKTTLAKLVYKQLYKQFDVFCFVPSVGERCEGANGRHVTLQSQMLRNLLQFTGEVDRGKAMLQDFLQGKKVLLLLDDIQSPEQLEALVGNYRDFGRGSCLIITSRDLYILKLLNVDVAYEVRRLPHEHALQLFNFHAFHNSSCPDQELETVRNDIVRACEGLPLALQLVGKLLVAERDINVWTDFAKNLMHASSLQMKLRAFYETLNSHEKEMFLDIACFFACEKKELAMMFLGEKIPSTSNESLTHLLQKSFVSLGPGNELLMHTCLRDLGKSIANEMSAQPPERTRLFKEEDVQHILRRYRVPGENAEHVRYLSYEPKEPVTLKAEMFESLYKLRLLWLTNVVIEGNFPEACFLDLIWLRWRRCSSKWLPPGRNLEKLVIMEVTNSQISHLWHESAQDYATIRPQKLKVLILSGCTSLETLPSTIAYTQLQILDLSNCNSLRSLPNTVGNLKPALPPSLQILDLSNCHSLTSLPNAMENFSSLVCLNMEGSGISCLPEDFGKLTSLEKLNLSRCKHLCKLPASFGKLIQLEKLRIHHNPKLRELPDCFGGLKALLYLDASDCQLCDDGLAAGIFELISLKVLHLERNGFHILPDGLEKLGGLWELHLDGCEKLSVLPAIPPSLQMLFARNCPQLKTMCCLSELKSLIRLDVSNSCHVTELHGLEALQGLLELKLVGCENIATEILESCLGRLKSLESVFIGGPGVSPDKLQCLYDSIKGISFNKQCLLTAPDMITSDWLEVEAAGRNGEEIKCAVEDKVKYCAG
ncbi:hypothetical protein KI387_011016, partial [Taxus chinensis]